MGCCCSSEPQQEPPREKPPRVTREHLVGVNIRDYSGIPAVKIGDALKIAGDHLQQQNQNITIIAAGGVADLYRLKKDHAIHDLLFFNHDPKQPERDALKAAFELGEKTYSAPIAQALWNQQAIDEMGYELEATLTKHTLAGPKPPKTIFQSGGLTVVGCPRLYSFITKVGRLGTNDERHYDLSDAVSYLNSLVIDPPGQKRRPVPVWESTIVECCKGYQKDMPSQEQLQRVNQEYFRRYNCNGLSNK